MATTQTQESWKVAKKKPKLTLYVDINARTRRRVDRLAQVEDRKLNAVVDRLLEQALDIVEKKQGLAPLPEEEDE